ncbi:MULTISPECIES: response regulator [Cyanophyceae]|uniref:hybrid sensor histidine kinase/response regulator n=1 Tax=Cyanophyceae TaxID=3028117 RepID=UPI00016DCE21|nr:MULTISPECIES: response regulator [Cyanophyceae]ACB00575.1 CheA like protein [Picosynechococcus sp. PCC 7002]SMH50466.1 type IV pili sensor histidine kinase and response regulator [Picosynechococcus sp. OG1]SMQ81838.1 type IV pili sensor histidine kinase and response regulator [Synechococcus sp. 7002]
MLDAASLKAIALEARHCFLLEDAPDFVELFHQSMGLLQAELQQPAGHDQAKLYQDLVRAAHSIKGGAGIAELSTLHNLAHQMEDLLEAIAAGRIKEEQTALDLISLAMEEVQHCLDLAARDDDHPGDSPGAAQMAIALQEFLGQAQTPAPEAIAPAGNAPSKFVATALKVDLEACVQRLEKLLTHDPTPRSAARQLKTLEEECRLLGDALGVPWLKAIATLIQTALDSAAIDSVTLSQGAIAEIRRLTQAYLTNPDEAKISESFQALLSVPEPPKLEIPETDPSPDPVPATPVNATPKPAPKQTSSLQIRMPIQQLNRMGNAVGELFIGYEKLTRHQDQLLRASRNLKKRTQQLNPIRDEVTALYDKLAVATAGSGQNGGSQKPSLELATATHTEFDTLHFDQYTQAHSQLQQFQELMVQVQEIQEDLELMRWEFQESLEGVRQQLEYLNQDLTQSRLMPFGNLARRFRQSLETLSKRYPQMAQLAIEGEQVLVDQAILEQLRTPLTHLIRNAFDHGIEPPQERRQAQKTETGTIRLSAQLRGNMVEILVQDDGRGIDLNRVQQKAIAKGLCAPNHQPTEAEILEYLFAPGFSTRDTVSDLSGRGLGLDIVRLELAQLKGTITASSERHQGTQFTIRIPLSFNILPLLLCRCQQQAIAFPSVTVQAVLSLVNKDNLEYPEFLDWQGTPLKLHALDQLLPYPQSNLLLPPEQRPAPTIGLIVRQGKKSLAIAVDEILGERELVLKSLDNTVAYPPYVAGCTVLGSGEVIPVLLPDAFDQLLASPEQPQASSPAPEQPKRQPTILVIDDSVAVRRTLNKLLNQVGYQVQQCRDGKEAWNLLNRSKQTFDLAICDLEMPGYDGFTLLQMVRGQSRWDHLPFVMLTSRDNDLHRQKAQDLGANDYFTKPFHPVRFLKAIAQYVEA